MPKAAPICTLGVALLICAGCADCPGAEPLHDEQALQGTWNCVTGSVNGKQQKDVADTRIVFVGNHLKISGNSGGMAFAFKLDASATPKRLELDNGSGVIFPAIFRLTGDMLEMVLVHSAKTYPLPYPSDFEPADGRNTYVFRRAGKSTEPAPPPTAQELAETAELHKALHQAAELLEAKKYHEFLERFGPLVGDHQVATNEARSTRDKRSSEEQPWVREYRDRRSQDMAKLFRRLEGVQPTFTDNMTGASFDIREMHFDALPGTPSLRLRKTAGRWRLAPQ